MTADLPPAAPPQAIIQAFARDGFQDRRIDGDRGLWVQSITGQWYYAAFLSRCARLPQANGLAFDPSPLGRLDKDSAIIVDGERCRFASLVTSAEPTRR